MSDAQVPVASWTRSFQTGLTFRDISDFPGLTLLLGGHIGGSLTLQSPKNPGLFADAVSGKVTYTPIDSVNAKTRPSPFSAFLRTFVGSDSYLTPVNGDELDVVLSERRARELLEMIEAVTSQSE